MFNRCYVQTSKICYWFMYTCVRKCIFAIKEQSNLLFYFTIKLENALTHKIIIKHQGIKQARVIGYFQNYKFSYQNIFYT